MERPIHERPTFDFPILLTAVVLWLIGIALVYSATSIHETGPLAHLARSQVMWVVMGVVIILLTVSVPTRYYYSLAYVIFGLSLLLLVYADFMGVISKGASRWIAIGGLKLQPSEFAKLGLLFALARYLSENDVSLDRITSFIMPGLLIIVPFVLVLKQPDLGTALVFCAMSLPLFFWAGLRVIDIVYLISPVLSLILSMVPLILAYHHPGSLGVMGAIPWGLFFVALCGLLYRFRPQFLLLVAIVAANLAVAFVTTVLWNNFLQDYQKTRIISFINPQSDPAGSGYQVLQSRVAIGSGHIVGKGYLKGTQTRLSFLPEQHTDFIFSVLGEQFGLMGCSAVILLFLFLVARSLMTIQRVRNRFTNLVIIGAATILSFHIFINIAMTIGMMPVVGVPLPFLSYGGSFTITIAVLIGLILNARASSQDF
jgi:rod shape determining protein RodA